MSYRPRTRSRQVAPLIAGKKLIAFTDSLGDTAPWNAIAPVMTSAAYAAGTQVAYGHFVTAICKAMGLVRLNANMIPNGSVETDPGLIAASYSGFSYGIVGGSVTWVSSGGSNLVHTGSKALKLVYAAGGFSFNIGATNATTGAGGGLNGSNGGAGGVRLFLQPGVTYTFSAYAAMPATNAGTGTPRLIAATALVAGGPYSFPGVSAQSVPKTSTWTRLTCSFTVPAGVAEAYIYIDWGGAGAPSVGDALFVDDIQLEPNSAVTAYTDWLNRGAISSTTLANYGEPSPYTIYGGFAGQISTTPRTITSAADGTAFGADAILCAGGINDIQYPGETTTNVTDGLAHPMTVAGYRSGLAACVAAWKALSPAPQIILGSLANSVRMPSPAPATPFYGSLDDLARRVNNATRDVANQNGCLYVPARDVPDVSLIDTATQGVHPNFVGMVELAGRYLDVMQGGG